MAKGWFGATLMACNYWMSHESCREKQWFSHRRISSHLLLVYSCSRGVSESCGKKKIKKKEKASRHKTVFSVPEEEEFKVLKWPCQSPHLNHNGNWWVLETGISCLLSWGSSVWMVGSKLIPSGITAYCVYVFFLHWMWKGNRNFFESEIFYINVEICWGQWSVSELYLLLKKFSLKSKVI